MHELINNQRKITIDVKMFEGFLENCFELIVEAKNRSAAIAIISDRKMRELNKQFRGKNHATDVLSFPFEDLSDAESATDGFQSDYLGDIAISVETAARQAKENNLSFEIEIKQLILHGILHLCGYDHETDNGEMNQRELELREILQI